MSHRTPSAIQARVASLAREVAVAIKAAGLTPEFFLRVVKASRGRPPRKSPAAASGYQPRKGPVVATGDQPPRRVQT